MDYKTELTGLAADLQSAIDKANALPDAGGGTPNIQPLEVTENGTYTAPDGVDGYSPVTVNVAGGGGTDGAELARSIVDKTITEYNDSEITSVGGYAFVGCQKITSVNVPKATSLGDYALSGCVALESVNIPLATSIGQYAFNACALLESFDGENLTTVGTYAFTGCSALTEINLPKATSVAGYAFNGTAFKHLSLPSMKSMASSAFRGSTFETCDFPLVTNIGNNAFRAQAFIKSVTFPNVTSTASEAMRNCSALTYVDLPLCASFGTYTFYDCTSLETLILRKTDKACTMGNVNVLTNTKIANGEGYVYVPSALVDTYKSATNWATYAAQIRAIEDYPEITGG